MDYSPSTEHLPSFGQASTTSSSGQSTPAIESSPTLSGASSPTTEKSVLFDDFQNNFLTNATQTSFGDDFILVVGGLGYLGSHTTLELLKAGQNVIIIDNSCNSDRDVLVKLQILTKKHFTIQSTQPLLEFYEADYRDQHALYKIINKYRLFLQPKFEALASRQTKVTGVIHFAAYKAVAESFQKPLQYYSNNVGGLIDFCSTLSGFGIKTFVFSSSATVYGKLADGGRLLEDQCDNSSCTGLTNPYGRTKWMCEAILNDLAISDPAWNIIALRYFNPIGCDESGMLGENPRDIPNNLMPIVIRAMTGEIPSININGSDWDTHDGTAIRDFIHVTDLARGHLAALEATKGPDFANGFHVYNLGTGKGHSVMEIINTMQSISGRKISTIMQGRREGDVGSCIADPSKSALTLNWKTEKSLFQACQDLCHNLGYLGQKESSHCTS